jgi:hypothetical protein
VVEDVVGDQQRVVDVPQADLLIAGDDEEDLPALEVVLAQAPVFVGIDVDVFPALQQVQLDPRTDAVVLRDNGATGDEEAAGLAPLLPPPGQVGVIARRDDGVYGRFAKHPLQRRIQGTAFEQR